MNFTPEWEIFTLTLGVMGILIAVIHVQLARERGEKVFWIQVVLLLWQIITKTRKLIGLIRQRRREKAHQQTRAPPQGDFSTRSRSRAHLDLQPEGEISQ